MNIHKKGFIILFVTILASNVILEEARAYTLDEYCTCRGVNRANPYNYIDKTNRFATSDNMAFVWVRLNNVDKSHKVTFTWIFFDARGGIYHRYINSWKTADPASQGLSAYRWYVIWDCIPINSPDSVGKWKVMAEVDGKVLFEQWFEVLSERDFQTRAATTVTVMRTEVITMVTTALKSDFDPNPIFVILIIIVFLSIILGGLALHAYSKPKLSGREGKYLEYIAKLEDLKSKGRISEEAYIKLRKEYEMKLKEGG